MQEGKRLGRWVIAGFALVVATFVVSIAVRQRDLAAIDGLAAALRREALPGIHFLSLARTQMRHLEIGVFDLIEAYEEGLPPRKAEVARQRRELGDTLTANSRLPASADERARRSDVAAELARVDDLMGRVLQEAEAGRIRRARQIGDDELRPAIDRIDELLSTMVRVNAARANEVVARIEEQRERAFKLALWMTFANVLLALVSALALRYVVGRFAAITEWERQRQVRRADELDQFAGRMAHDVLSPLTAVGMYMASAQRRASDPEVREQLGKARAGLSRVRPIIDGLLEFARASARPQEGARADVQATVAATVAQYEPMARAARIALRARPIPPCTVACSPGVLAVLLGNLIENAIKYMGDACVREIRASVAVIERRVIFGVEDTGPGVPRELASAVFEPYVRAAAGEAGIGLGLATVKKLVEGHGGHVAVDSQPGRGARFRFDLPLV